MEITIALWRPRVGRSRKKKKKKKKMLSKCRKVDVECRVFNEEWENKYFFMNHFGKPTCLICNVSASVNKEFNIKLDYDTKHSNFSKFVGQARKDKLDRLKDSLKQQSSVFQKQTTDSKNNTLTSCRVAQIIAEEKRVFTDGEFAKKCVMAVESICPKKKSYF